MHAYIHTYIHTYIVMMMITRPTLVVVHVLFFFSISATFMATYHIPVNADIIAPPPSLPLLHGHIFNGTSSTNSTTSTTTTTTSPNDEILRVCLASKKQDPSLKPQCEGALYESLQPTLDVYTLALAERFSFCIDNPVRERNATFGFDGNLTFLSNCFDETAGLIMQYMCSGAEIKAYLNSLVYLIQGSANAAASASITDINCNQSSWSKGCEPGWAKSQSETVTNMSDLYQDDTTIPVRSNLADLPCCDGFFCPRSLGCMMPCPLGAQCTKTTLVGGLCAPYNYPLTPGAGYSCGGANLWASLSVSSGLFCPAGSYCPSTSDVRPCDKGHFCRQGSTAQTKCFQLTNCDEQSTTQHIQTYGIILILGMGLIVIFMYKCSNRIRKVRRERKDKMREKAIRQVKERFNTAKKWRSAASVVKKLGRTISGVTRSSINGQSLHSSSMVRSERASFRIQSSNNGERRFNEVENMEDSRRSSAFTDIEQELYEAPESSQGKRSKLHSRSQILRYAYGQIEIEKAMQSKTSSWKELVQVVGRDQARISNDRLKIEIAFKDLSLFLKSNGKNILCNVTGKLSPGRVTAVMGPSGAGKTTFLNALAGKAYNSYTTGVVLINGKPDPIKCYKKVIGFVAQDDIVHGNLTVEENLWFSARYRLPVGMPKPEKVLVVERIIDALGLEQIRSSKVGSVEKRGISGGQRKRVNVGLEMVMEPSLLILDEPTSGLDSTSSFLVLRALRREAHAGVNVGVVLHQPSYGLFRMFDDVMFLAKGGRTVYLGPVDEVENYFAAMGIVVPDRINPPDHFMDVLEGITRPGEQQPFDPTILPLKWIQYKGYDVSRDLLATSESQAYSLEIRSQGPNARSSWNCRSFVEDVWVAFTSFIRKHWDEFKSTFTRYEDLSMRRTPGFFRQYKMIVSRLALQRIREARLQTQDYFILLLCGAGLGVIVPTTDSSLGSSNYAFVIIAISLLCMVASLRTFTNDKLQFWRESASGINRVAYFLAKDTMDLFNVAIKPVVFLSMFYFFNNSRSTFAENYIVTLALVYCVTGIAYIFAVIMDSSPAQLWSVFLPIIATLLATKQKLPTLLRFIHYANYARWALEAYVIANVKRYGGVWLITRCALLYSTKYDIKNWALCLGILFGMGFVTRFIALFCLILCNRRRQQ